MKPVIVLGNWKANKTVEEAKAWVKVFSTNLSSLPANGKIIICPAFHHLSILASANLPLFLGVQDVSPFGSGAYTGEITASMVAGTVSYALLGHSERRRYFGETDEIVANKVKQCLRVGISPIVCVSALTQAENLKKSMTANIGDLGMVLYEPLFAVGTGQPDSPENANQMAMNLKRVLGGIPILYGGSVNPENVGGFVQQEYLAGVGVGGASLDPETFYQLVLAASSVGS